MTGGMTENGVLLIGGLEGGGDQEAPGIEQWAVRWRWCCRRGLHALPYVRHKTIRVLSRGKGNARRAAHGEG